MITQWTAALMVASLVGGQAPGVVAANVPNGTASGAPSELARGAGNGAGSESLVVPTGTSVALTLMTPIQSKATKVGDTVRAVVAFPVTVGTRVAIPAGTYVEGLVNAVAVHGPSVKIHFTRMLFANGYSVPLDAMNTQASVEWPGAGPQRVGELAWDSGPPVSTTRAEETNPTNPTLPPLPQEGPSKGAIIGASIGGLAALVVLSVVMTHHRGGANYVLFDNGWQFQMVLATPLTLDASRVAAAS
jgi:hypothetical protein